jgi:hypothetical protein
MLPRPSVDAATLLLCLLFAVARAWAWFKPSFIRSLILCKSLMLKMLP